ncbi:MAG TPA: energy transducer TonB [Hanamia sp.]|nr:energy transducer TonB [Hanamia sp.]
MIAKTFVTSLLFFVATVSLAQQTDYVYYFNEDFGICPKEESVFTGHGREYDNLFNLKVYSNQFPSKPLLVANFTDSTLSVNQGTFQSFYLNGKKETERNYENNILNGLWRKWDSTGHIIDSLMYVNGKVTDSSKYYYSESGILNSFSSTDFKNDKFQQTFYDDSGKVTSEVFFTGQKGIRKDYKDGTVVVDSLFTREEKEASFRGGAQAWLRYITGKLTSNIDKFSEKDYGTCVVRFIIDTTGKVRDVQATTMKGTMLAYIAVEAIKNGPKWIPAMQYGRLVKAYRLQPVTLGSR